MDKAVGLDAFWTALASHAPPATQLALLGTCSKARDAVVQCAPKATLTLQLSPTPSPDTMGLMRTSGRTLPATVIININNPLQQQGPSWAPSPLDANRMARLSLPWFGCAAVTSLQLGGGPWLVDTALLTDICAALPGLSKLVLTNITTPPHFPTGTSGLPPLSWPALRAVSLETFRSCTPPIMVQLLSALGIREGGGVTSLDWDCDSCDIIGTAIRLSGNQFHALRKLSLPTASVYPNDFEALLHNTPVLEHLKVQCLEMLADPHADEFACEDWIEVCVPWRILEVRELEVPFTNALPLGTYPGQPPLILRVTHRLFSDLSHHDSERVLSPPPDVRRVQLECTRAAYHNLDSIEEVHCILCLLTLTSAGLSHLLLDGIDSADDDLKGLVNVTTSGITIKMCEGGAVTAWALEPLHLLPQVTRLQLEASLETWATVDDDLLASLPDHVTHVCLIGGPALEVVSQMCVNVSRLPHRQVEPLKLCVWGVEGWFDATVKAMDEAGIDKPGVVCVMQSDWKLEAPAA